MDLQPAIDSVTDVLSTLPRDLAYIGLVLLLLVIARFVKDLLTPYRLREEMSARDHNAVGLSVAGYYLGVLIVCAGPLSTAPEQGSDPTLWADLGVTAGYGLLGIFLLNVARVVVDRVLLRGLGTAREIMEDRNVGTGAVEMGAYVASALVIAGSLQGHGGGPHTAVAMFAIGQVALVIYGRVYPFICRYDVRAEIEKDNAAAGVALAMNLVAMGIVVMKGVAGNFIGWPEHLGRLGAVYLVGFVFLALLHVLVDFLLLPGVRIRDEIVGDRNLNLAWVEGALLAGMAGLLVEVM